MGRLAAVMRLVAARSHGVDASHDFTHVQRVAAMAARLAREEGVLEARALLRISLAALLHDVEDHKYGGDEEGMPVVRAILSEAGFGGASGGSDDGSTGAGGDGGSLRDAGSGVVAGDLEPGDVERVLATIRKVSFHGELAAAAAGGSGDGGGGGMLDVEAACVQDADRLDAIGAVGIARCFTFGGARGRVLHDPAVPPAVGMTREEYTRAGRQQTTLNHFHEKLLLLKDKMKTAAGRRIAEQRHAVTAAFVEQFEAEWRGER
jgi:uncharacterized protein